MKKICSLLMALLLLLGLWPGMPLQNAEAADVLDLKVGNFVSFGTFDGKDMLWQVLHIDGDQCLLYCSEELLRGEFDASMHCYQSTALMSMGDIYGSVDWLSSDVRTYLNADSDFVLYDNSSMYFSPSSKMMRPTGGWGTDDPEPSYADEPGFLSSAHFTMEERCLIEETTRRVHPATSNPNAPGATAVQIKNIPSGEMNRLYDEYGSAEVTDEMFLLNAEEFDEYCSNMESGLYCRDSGQFENVRYFLADSVQDKTGGWYIYDTCVLVGYSNDGYWMTPVSGNSDYWIRPACYISLSYLTGLDGSGTVTVQGHQAHAIQGQIRVVGVNHLAVSHDHAAPASRGKHGNFLLAHLGLDFGHQGFKLRHEPVQETRADGVVGVVGNHMLRPFNAHRQKPCRLLGQNIEARANARDNDTSRKAAVLHHVEGCSRSHIYHDGILVATVPESDDIAETVRT